MFNPQKILVIAPHTDDGELGCGASVAKFCAEGREVHYVAFCLCDESLPAGFPSGTLGTECRQATAILGIDPARVQLLDFEVRTLPAARQKVLEELRRLNKTISPDLVFIPSSGDIHQDHQVIHQEGLRAFKHITIAGYELPWNQYHFNASFFIRAGESHMDKKIAALNAYVSQSHRDYMQEAFTRSLAQVRGMQCNAPFAEAFELYRGIM